MQIRPYTSDLEPAVKALNARLRAGGECYWSFPESYIPSLPKEDDNTPYQEFYVTYDNGNVRGGYLLTHHRFAIHGQMKWIACGPQLNLSEGIVDRNYLLVGAINIRDALLRQPYLYGLGMGGIDMPIAKMVSALRWHLSVVPFYFKVINPSRFFEQITYLRKTPLLRTLMDFLKYSGTGWAGVKLAQFSPRKQAASITGRTVQSFGDWADSLWTSCLKNYTLVGARDAATLNRLYPSSDPNNIRLQIQRHGNPIGWAVVRDSRLDAHKHFGSMRLGSIVDCLASPEDASTVISRSSSFLEERGVDLIVSNQASPAWGNALLHSGFLKGPSNFILAFSPALAALLEPMHASASGLHINRGDGDGPVHL